MRPQGQKERTFTERLALIPMYAQVTYGCHIDDRWYAYWRDAKGYHTLYMGLESDLEVAREMHDRTTPRCSRGHELFYFWCAACHAYERYMRTGRPVSFGKVA